ncbi:MAG: SUF system NifU family Fe-S cluster assembly protein [Actinomycetota bacterium]|jgi:nitrogen fixation protein NifU and related proteins|nr:SUF system NifU family Fe-S cluster assembly protein [Actinomycetota bacterium]MDA3023507.1 SUF system NifU family Fe-S cluster assembly protein [Actinomycetota bacterium]
MSELEDLYQEIILDHYRSPRNRAPGLAGEDAHVHHSNPLCGDEMDLRVRIRDGVLDGLAFDGEGCSISQASASAMSVAVLGRPVDDVLELVEQFRLMMHGEAPDRADDLGDGMVFEGVARFPVRVKCALLGWMALRDAVDTFRRGEEANDVTHEGDHE